MLGPKALSHQKVLVTGATRGIGLSIVKAFVRGGADVVGTGRSPKDLRAVRKVLGSGFCGKQVDFSSAGSLKRFCEWVLHQDFTVLVNNAGTNQISAIGKLSQDDWEELLKVNLTAPILLSRATSGGMAARRYGRIVHISSIWGLVGKPGRAAYAATKSALLGLTRAMALDLAGKNVLVNSVCPGFTDTELTRRILAPGELALIARSIPLGRIARPDEIASVVLFLASPDNTYMTGQYVVVDGGYTIQ